MCSKSLEIGFIVPLLYYPISPIVEALIILARDSRLLIPLLRSFEKKTYNLRRQQLHKTRNPWG